MSNKTLLYTSSLLPSFWIFCNDWHALQAEFFHLQLAPKKPKSLPGLSVFPSHLKAFWKTQIQVLLCDFAQNRSPLATVLDICKNALCLILFTATWAWDTSWKFCTCLNEKRPNTCSSGILGPSLCPSGLSGVSLCDLSGPIPPLLFIYFICHPIFHFSFFLVMATTQISPEFSVFPAFRERKLHIFGFIQAQMLEQSFYFPWDASCFKKCHFSCEASIERAAPHISHQHWKGRFSTNSRLFSLKHCL